MNEPPRRSRETERTFVMLKPDAFERGLAGEIIARLERKGLRARRMELRILSRAEVARHYAHLLDKPFYAEIEAYATRGPVLAMIWEGRDATAVVRRLVGETDGANAAPGTIRGDFSCDMSENLVHASDSPDAAAREIKRFFPDWNE